MFDEILQSAEAAVLTLVFQTGGRCLDEIALVPEHFEKLEHERLFGAMLSCYRHGAAVDAIGLAEALPGDRVLIFTLNDSTPLRASAEHYAEIVRRHAMRRAFAELGVIMQGLDAALTEDAMVELVRSKTDKVVGVARARVDFMPELWDAAVASVSSSVALLPSPWVSLDEVIGGFGPGRLYVIGARPGIGKTVVALNIASRLGQTGVAAYSSLEMGREELTLRGIASHAGVSIDRLSRNRLDGADWELVAKSRPEFVSMVAIDDRSAGVGPMHIRQFARSVSRRGELRGIIVDYLQLMTSRSGTHRQEQVAEFSRELKILAKDLRVPVIALSQLNRNSEAREGKRPVLSELRESGAIEQDADVVMLLSRDDDSNDIHFDIAKNRHGRQGVVTLQWRGDISRVVDYQDLRPQR